jgi:hypothetical protein
MKDDISTVCKFGDKSFSPPSLPLHQSAFFPDRTDPPLQQTMYPMKGAFIAGPPRLYNVNPGRNMSANSIKLLTGSSHPQLAETVASR